MKRRIFLQALFGAPLAALFPRIARARRPDGPIYTDDTGAIDRAILMDRNRSTGIEYGA